MEGSKDLIVSFDALITVEERDGCWAARIDPIGMVVYGDTRGAVEERVSQAVEFFLKNTPDVRHYLDYHKIPHQVRYAVDDDSEKTDRRILPVSARLKNRAFA